MNEVKIAIAEDHGAFRRTIVKLLKEVGDLQVVIEARDGIDLLNKLQLNIPDIILMDIRMPEMDGLETTRVVRDKYPQIKIIALTQFNENTNIIEMSRMGVKSFISKELSDQLLKAIKIVHSGGVYYPDEIGAILQQSLTYSLSGSDQIKLLNDVEKIVIKSTCEGLSSTDIGKILHRSHRTIEDYRERLYKKFNVNNKEQLIVKAVKYDLV